MAEFEVVAHLEGDTDVEIDFSAFSREQRLMIIEHIVKGKKFTFKGIPVSLEGETMVDIEPMDYH